MVDARRRAGGAEGGTSDQPNSAASRDVSEETEVWVLASLVGRDDGISGIVYAEIVETNAFKCVALCVICKQRNHIVWHTGTYQWVFDQNIFYNWIHGRSSNFNFANHGPRRLQRCAVYGICCGAYRSLLIQISK